MCVTVEKKIEANIFHGNKNKQQHKAHTPVMRFQLCYASISQMSNSLSMPGRQQQQCRCFFFDTPMLVIAATDTFIDDDLLPR